MDHLALLVSAGLFFAMPRSICDAVIYSKPFVFGNPFTFTVVVMVNLLTPTPLTEPFGVKCRKCAFHSNLAFALFLSSWNAGGQASYSLSCRPTFPLDTKEQ